MVFLAAATFGLAGFGFSILSMPAPLIFYNPSTVIALNEVLTLGTTWMAPVTGLAGGLSSTSTGVSGPPLVLLFTVIGLPAQMFRATSVAYFLLIDLVGFPSRVTQGVISRSDIVPSLLLAPAAVAGRWAGSLLVPYVTPARFRRVVPFLLLGTGTIAIVNAVAKL